jgi:predicted 3-demethylubiquinone-9 3-methyltransferase (glyoxalase superfamily)/pimeloyl-ACP methyl ester carboxylesterase
METFTVEAGGTSLLVRTWGDPDRPALLYWDGLGGCALHANELAPILVADHGLRVVALDAPGHGGSPALALEDYAPSNLARVAAELLDALGVEKVVFCGFSWGAMVGCAFAARYPERAERLVLVDGGYLDYADVPGFEASLDLAARAVAARAKAHEEHYESWEAYFAAEGAALGRWTPALQAAHRETMREEDGAIVPVLEAGVEGAIKHGCCREPTRSTYPALRAAGTPVLLVAPAEPSYGALAEAGIARFRDEVPQLRVERLPGDVHDLVSNAPEALAAIVGGWLDRSPGDEYPPPRSSDGKEPRTRKDPMRKITPCLWFDTEGEEAAELYTSLFPNSRILDVARYGPNSPRPEGTVMTVKFALDGQEFVALNGGPQFTFSESISFQVSCEGQEEVDALWNALVEGGEESQCGWLKDRFGLSWQIVPTALPRLLGDPDREKASRAMQAMLGMKKIDIAGLERAAAGA